MRPPAEARYPNLSAPLQRGRLALKNRLMMMATVTNLGTNARITDAQVAFYAERARGGVAAIVTEGMSVHPTSIPNPYVPLAFEPGLRSDLQRLANAVHAHECAIYAQLWHVGRNALWNPSAVPWAPSPVRDPYSGSTPHAMTVAELNEVAEGFVATAELVRAAGFDGVELHGAHGYLITQTLSPWSNQRVDAYGGSLLNRTRLVREIINGIRDRTDDRFVIGLKLSVDEFVSGGLTLEESARIIGILGDDAAPDYIGVSQANFSMPSLERHVPGRQRHPHGCLSASVSRPGCGPGDCAPRIRRDPWSRSGETCRQGISDRASGRPKRTHADRCPDRCGMDPCRVGSHRRQWRSRRRDRVRTG
jgi:2,4-dienoyl-CoA reductase-like NADH-dependent reductase (Old Yellow Enzyme family)